MSDVGEGLTMSEHRVDHMLSKLPPDKHEWYLANLKKHGFEIKPLPMESVGIYNRRLGYAITLAEEMGQ